jgi:hypothetical protein
MASYLPKKSIRKSPKSDSAVSLRPRDWFPQSHWNRGIRFCGLIETAESELCKRLSQFSRRKRSHMPNGFRPWIRALGGIVWWKKTEGRKSRDTVPLIAHLNHHNWTFTPYEYAGTISNHAPTYRTTVLYEAIVLQTFQNSCLFRSKIGCWIRVLFLCGVHFWTWIHVIPWTLTFSKFFWTKTSYFLFSKPATYTYFLSCMWLPL